MQLVLEKQRLIEQSEAMANKALTLKDVSSNNNQMSR